MTELHRTDRVHTGGDRSSKRVTPRGGKVVLITAISSALTCCASPQICPPVMVAPVAPATAPKPVLVPVDLDLHLVAGFETCPGARRAFVITVDGIHAGTIDVACTEIVGVIRAPPPSYTLTVPSVKPGAHVIRVHEANGVSGAGTIMLPALQASPDGAAVFVGGHVRVWVTDREVRIEPPTAFGQKMM
jgi:hypothetical protein